MLKTYKYPQIPDQDKEGTGNVLLGVQDGESITPLTFSTGGNNSAIISFTAVKFNQYRKEVDRIDLDTSLIAIDLTNNIYKVDGLTDYATALENGMYRFEFQNNFNLWKTEYFKVIDQDLTTPKILITMTPTALFTAGINLTFASGTLTIDWKDGSATENFVSGVELTHQYVDAGTNIAEITGDFINITKFIADNNRITSISNLTTGLLNQLNIANNLFAGILDLSLAPISSLFIVNNNSGLTGFIFAASGNGKINIFYFNDCNIIGGIDLQTPGITIGLDIRGFNNNNFTGFTFATSGNTIVSNWRMYGCAIISQDFTNVPLSGILWFYDNFVTTTLIFAVSGNGAIVQFYADDNILPNIDFSVFPSSTPNIRMFNNSLTATEHDNQLINIDATGWINGILTIVPGNTARTAASDAAYTNLGVNGWTLT